MSNRWSRQAALVLLMFCCKVMCMGVLEVSLVKLHNHRGVTHNGRCCTGGSTSPPCAGECRTFVTVCLLHYTQSMPSKRQCSYGQTSTAVIGGNNIVGADDNPNTTIKIPINLAWPGQFTLIAEAWHDIDGLQSIFDANQMIIQNFRSASLVPSYDWQFDTSTTPTTELKVKYRLTCNKHYFGAGCDVLCRSRDDQFGHYTCDENGIKTCNTGWKGSFCDQPECSSECLRNMGTCERPFECRCRLGWRGRDCGECRPYTGCLHGYCNQPYQCICEDGWTGILCDVDTQYCSKRQPCENGGTCVSDMAGNYTCVCPPGFGGDNCQFPLCFKDFCQNDGTCRTRNGARECECLEGFYGDQCQRKMMACEELACQNGGQCVEGRHGGMCHCADGFKGLSCERRINPCLANPCQNGAECRERQSMASGYKCLCPIGFGGKHCDVPIDPCSGVTCYHSGKCTFKQSRLRPYCECQAGFSGEFCEDVLDPCRGVSCQNSGTCKVSPSGNGFICYCPKGYHGEICELKMNPCESSPCQNGGTCKNYISRFLCICSAGFSGKICERSKHDDVFHTEPSMDDDDDKDDDDDDAFDDGVKKDDNDQQHYNPNEKDEDIHLVTNNSSDEVCNKLMIVSIIMSYIIFLMT